MKRERIKLGKGIALTCITTKKFKSSCMSAMFAVPLGEMPAASLAILPGILRRGTERFHQMKDLSIELDRLYGARIEPTVRKTGEMLVTGFLCDTIDSAYASSGENLTMQMAELLGELFTKPYLENSAFSKAYVAGEKELHKDLIASIMNDKRGYAMRRLHALMCSKERFGLSELGEKEQVDAITVDTIMETYRRLLKTAPIELFYCGTQTAEEVSDALFPVFSSLEREDILKVSTDVVRKVDGEVREFVEQMDVTQGKLCMGFRTGITAEDPNYADLVVFNALFGGGTMSKLFLQVREKLSLCYYASSQVEKLKGIMTVSAGIENEKKAIVCEEILKQWKLICKGDVSDAEWLGAKRTVVSALRLMQDSPLLLETFWQTQAIGGLSFSVEDFIERVEKTKLEDVMQVASGIELDSIYFLKGVPNNG